MSEDADSPSTHTLSVDLVRYSLNPLQLEGLASEFLGQVIEVSGSSAEVYRDAFDESHQDVELLFSGSTAREDVDAFTEALAGFAKPSAPPSG